MSFFISFSCAFLAAFAATPTVDWVTDVHIVFSNHLDVGFGSFAYYEVNLYFDTYFPLAVAVATNVSVQYNKAYSWMTQAWLVDMYMNCPPNMRLHCPTDTEKQSFVEGVEKGYIYWHAFPFNCELETYDKSMVEFGLHLSKTCSEKYNSTVISNTISQRDVPGMTRAMIPVLLENEITAISIGVNSGSAPPAMPSICRWRDVNNDTIITMVHPGGYGGYQLSDDVYLTNFNHALVMAWNEDNGGPQTVEQVIQIYDHIATNFPNATNIHASSFTSFVNELYLRPDIIESLPIFDGEMGDTWIEGITSDPYKIAAHREAQRQRSECLAANACSLNDYEFYNFSRLLLKNGEHTWGGSVSKFLNEKNETGIYYDWSNEAFLADLLSDNGANELTSIRSTWYEQRDWGLTFALQALNLSTNEIYINLANSIQQEWDKLLNVQSPFDVDNDTLEWIAVDIESAFTVQSLLNNHNYKLQFDADTGSISYLADMDTNVIFASDDHMLGTFWYQTLTQTVDYTNFELSYYYRTVIWRDMTKVGLNESSVPYVEHQYISASVVNLYQSQTDLNQFLVELNFGEYQELLFKLYGAMETVYNHISFSSERSTFSMNLIWINKTLTRMPEAIYFEMNPVNCNSWSVEKIGEKINLDNIIFNGSYHMHGFTGNISCSLISDIGSAEDMEINIESMEAALAVFQPRYTTDVGFGKNEFTPFPTPFVNITAEKGMAFLLCNNVWGTNYVQWYPFAPGNDSNANSTFRFYIHLPT